MTYVNPITTHDPATGALAPATWGDVVNQDLEHLHDRYDDDYIPPALEYDGATYFATPLIAVNSISAVSNRPTSNSQYVYFNWHVPDNYASTRILRIEYMPQNGGTPTLECVANYRAEGEPYNAHTGTISASRSQTAGQLMYWDIGSALPSMAAGDFCSIRVRPTSGWPGGYFGALGIWFSWYYL